MTLLCTLFIFQVRDARNATMHSAFMKMSNADFLVHTDAMIALLQDPLLIDKIEEAQNAVKEIQKVVNFFLLYTEGISCVEMIFSLIVIRLLCILSLSTRNRALPNMIFLCIFSLILSRLYQLQWSAALITV